MVLGTATPSLESWYNHRQGRYERLELADRAAPGAELPIIRTVDLRDQALDEGFAPPVLTAIGERLARGEQSLVFISRRGYAPELTCEACGWCASCERCSARLVLHAVESGTKNRKGSLRCHHCGAEAPVARACPTCGNVDLKPMGRGTQRIEETLTARFPGARIVRIDRDSARRRAELVRTLAGLRRGEGDILVGTQLLAKEASRIIAKHDAKKPLWQICQHCRPPNRLNRSAVVTNVIRDKVSHLPCGGPCCRVPVVGPLKRDCTGVDFAAPVSASGRIARNELRRSAVVGSLSLFKLCRSPGPE